MRRSARIPGRRRHAAAALALAAAVASATFAACLRVSWMRDGQGREQAKAAFLLSPHLGWHGRWFLPGNPGKCPPRLARRAQRQGQQGDDGLGDLVDALDELLEGELAEIGASDVSPWPSSSEESKAEDSWPELEFQEDWAQPEQEADEPSAPLSVGETAAESLALSDQGILPEMLSAGLQRAPEYGPDMYVGSLMQIQATVDMRVKSYTVKMNALARYIEDLEGELDETHESLEAVENRLKVEQKLRLEAEEERDELKRQEAALSARLVDDADAQMDFAERVEELDREANLMAERLDSGQVSEEEAARVEEQLIEAQAQQAEGAAERDRLREQYSEIQKLEAAATARAESAANTADELRDELESMRSKIDHVTSRYDDEVRRRQEAEGKFQELVQRIQARKAAR